MRYDVSAKILMDRCRDEILRRFAGMDVAESTILDPLPQETVSLRRSDFPLLVTEESGVRRLVILELQSRWETEVPLRLLEYRSRYLLKYGHMEVLSCVLLLRPSKTACDIYEDGEVRFVFRLIRLDEMEAREVIEQQVLCLMPFVPLMRDGALLTEQADRLIYESSLPRGDKADMLTAMTILSGLVSSEIPRAMMARRRDIMIESAAYDIIRQVERREGLHEARRDDILKILKVRFRRVPQSCATLIRQIENDDILDQMLELALTTASLEEFRQAVEELLQ